MGLTYEYDAQAIIDDAVQAGVRVAQAKICQALAKLADHYLSEWRKIIGEQINIDIEAYLQSRDTRQPLADLYLSPEVFQVFFGCAVPGKVMYQSDVYMFIVYVDENIVGWAVR